MHQRDLSVQICTSDTPTVRSMFLLISAQSARVGRRDSLFLQMLKDKIKVQREDSQYWQKLFVGICCLSREDVDEGKTSCVLCSWPVQLIAPLCLKPVLRRPNKAILFCLKKIRKWRIEYLPLTSIRVRGPPGKHFNTTQLRCEIQSVSCDPEIVFCSVQTVTVWQGDSSVMPIFALSTAARQKSVVLPGF